MSEVKFNRTPYTVRYTKDGETKTIRRIPPPKLHPVLKGDEVTIRRKKNDDWDDGDDVMVKNVSQRQPNTLTIEKGDGQYTFISFRDVEWSEREDDALSDDERDIARDPIGSRYLLWP